MKFLIFDIKIIKLLSFYYHIKNTKKLKKLEIC